MQFLIDACVAGAVVRALRDAGFDVEWVAEWEIDPGDTAVLHYAHRPGVYSSHATRISGRSFFVTSNHTAAY